MAVPYSNRTATFIIPEIALRDRPKLSCTCKELCDDLFYQVANLKEYVECLLWIANNRVRVTFVSGAKMEDFIHQGATFGGHPIEIRPCSTANTSIVKRVTILRLAYGVPDGEIVMALSPFGKVRQISIDSVRGIRVGSRTVQMEIQRPIPSQLIIRGHSCLVFYRGQIRSCFRCNQPGHVSRNCPSARPRAPPSGPAQGSSAAPPSSSGTAGPSTTSAASSTVAGGVSSVVTSVTPMAVTVTTSSSAGASAPIRNLASFAARKVRNLVSRKRKMSAPDTSQDVEGNAGNVSDDAPPAKVIADDVPVETEQEGVTPLADPLSQIVGDLPPDSDVLSGDDITSEEFSENNLQDPSKVPETQEAEVTQQVPPTMDKVIRDSNSSVPEFDPGPIGPPPDNATYAQVASGPTTGSSVGRSRPPQVDEEGFRTPTRVARRSSQSDAAFVRQKTSPSIAGTGLRASRSSNRFGSLNDQCEGGIRVHRSSSRRSRSPSSESSVTFE